MALPREVAIPRCPPARLPSGMMGQMLDERLGTFQIAGPAMKTGMSSIRHASSTMSGGVAGPLLGIEEAEPHIPDVAPGGGWP